MSSEQYRIQDCIADILDNIERIERHVAGRGREDLAHDGLRRDAVERCLERICEAGFRLGERAPVVMPDQPWPLIRGLGNRLRHAYDRIDFAIVWEVVIKHLPSLKSDASAALAKLTGEGQG